MTARSNGRKLLLFYSSYPFASANWAVFEELVSQRNFRVTVIAPPKAGASETSMHAPLGYLSPDLINLPHVDGRCVPLRVVENPWLGFEPSDLDAALSGLEPDAIWIYPEPVCDSTRQLLRRYYWRRKPRIVCSVIENLFQRPPFLQRLKGSFLCSRIDALLAASTLSSNSFLRQYWTRRTKAYTMFMPTLDPLELGQSGFAIDRQSGEFWVGFVGRICQEKGWEDFIYALRNLPENVKAVIAGDGPDTPQLTKVIESLGLNDRIKFAGLIGESDLAALYHQVDVIVVPSKTTPRWKEQFGRVIAEAMGASRVIVGYSSGSIAEVVDAAGLTVTEGNAEGLTEAINALLANPDLREALGKAARKRFEQEFSAKAFARKLGDILTAPKLP
jgi:glycosyltransferase involved in cell wall biosynthesis